MWKHGTHNHSGDARGRGNPRRRQLQDIDASLFVHDASVNGQPMRRSKVKGNVLVFRNHEEDRTSCIVLNILKTENQVLWAARKERVTVQYSRRERMIADTNVAMELVYYM